ncbi:hypothetical protein QUF80_02305 [Desulfococcaceae bacterium HSG8]|nr:hypothetical protein [Desulfococcaceae bacterium HSG8]
MTEIEKQTEIRSHKSASALIADNAGRVTIKEGGTIVKQGGELMNKPEEKSSKLIQLGKAKSDRADSEDGTENTGADASHSESIGKIRDLIFGNEMQGYEKRFGRLEERMFKEMTDSKSEARESFDSLEKIVNKELESLKDRIVSEENARNESFRSIERQLKDIKRALDDRITSEENARAESLRDTTRHLKDATRSLEKRIGKLSEEFDRSSRELQRETSEQSRNLRDEIRQKYEETASAIERVAQELRTNKVDRSALSDFFTEMAIRINNDR